MKVRFNRWYNTVLTALLAMLGYGCSESEEPEKNVLMYGCIVAYYTINGTVTDEAGAPVQGIKTSVKMLFRQDIVGMDSVQTDESGKYLLGFNEMMDNEYTKLIVEDVDGEANGGEFLSDTLDIDFKKAVKTNNYRYEISQDVKLKKK
jgi:putative lipoprotein (rSAM/lipoprotein system)